MQTETTTSHSSDVADLLSAYIDGRVTPAERLNVETHVAVCAECQSQLRSLQATVALLHGLPVMPAPRTFYIYPGMVPEKRKSPLAALLRPAWVYGALRLAASVASLLLVMVIAADALGPLGPQAAAPLQVQPANRGAAQGATLDLSPTQPAAAPGAATAAPAPAAPAPTAPVVAAAVPMTAAAPLASPSPGMAREALATPATPVAPPAAATATPATAMAGPAPGTAATPPAGLTAATPTPLPATVAKAGPDGPTPTLVGGAAPSPTSRPSADTAVQPLAVATPAPSPAAAETSRYLPPAPQVPAPQPTGAPSTGVAQPDAADSGAGLPSPVRALEAALAVVVIALVALALLARRASGGNRS
jgi:hypothetical protein